MTPEQNDQAKWYWEEYGPAIAAEAENPRSVRVHGQFSWITDGENSLSLDSGGHTIEFFDGRKVHTRGASFPKAIPEEYREALPDNAVFVHPVTGEEVDWWGRPLAADPQLEEVRAEGMEYIMGHPDERRRRKPEFILKPRRRRA